MDLLQILEYGLREYGAVIVLSSIYVVAMVTVSRLARRAADKWWRDHLHDFAPIRAQKMIERRDAKIEDRDTRIRELLSERRSMVDAIRAAATFSDRAREILTQPEIIRIREKREAESTFRLKRRAE